MTFGNFVISGIISCNYFSNILIILPQIIQYCDFRPKLPQGPLIMSLSSLTRCTSNKVWLLVQFSLCFFFSEFTGLAIMKNYSLSTLKLRGQQRVRNFFFFYLVRQVVCWYVSLCGKYVFFSSCNIIKKYLVYICTI